MLDVARHFFHKDVVLRLIDVLADYKVNRLHLHLTDDQGWRIHIESWPDLTRIGGATQVGGGTGGFYTQADYTEIVEYAAARHVVVVPEIDMPGHIHAALASYPELNESGVAPDPYTGIGVGFSSLWLGAEVTERFVGDVLREVAAMTPGAYLHIGGDEVPDGDPAGYAALIERAHDVVTAEGKTLVGWEEIAHAGIGAGTIAQYWLRAEDAASAAGDGAEIISSPSQHAYLDMKYDADTPVGTIWAGFTDLRDAYEWDPIPPGVDAGSVLGVEAPLWTETVETEADLQLLMFPRVLGHAELGWSEDVGWDGYRVRLAAHGERLTRRSIVFHAGTEVDW
jgi:hexosaminidase